MPYIKIQNNKEVEKQAITLLGASSKRDDSGKIGFFGSGFKYAIAVLLRNNIDIKIYSGTKEIVVGTKKTKFRGVDFEIITIDKKETSLTTDIGIDWKVWFAIRELYCNAIDEGEHTISLADSPEGQKGKTNVFIKLTDETKGVLDNWNKYFSEKRKDILVESGGDKIFRSNTDTILIYRKGIQVYEEPKSSLYHYDLRSVEINESRVVKNTWSVFYDITNLLKRRSTIEMAEEIFECKDTFESKIDWDTYEPFNNNWLSAIAGRTLLAKETGGYFADELTGKELILPDVMVKSLKKTFGDKVKVMGQKINGNDIIVKPTQKEIEVIAEGVEILKRGELNITFPINVYIPDDKNTLGMAKDGEIFISRRVLTMGRRAIIATLIEEYAHIDSGSGDKTRSFQNYLIDMFINQIEEKTGERL